MAKFVKNVVWLFWALLIPISLSAEIPHTPRPCPYFEVKVYASIQHISDIDFVKLEYKMELWLILETEDPRALNKIENQITIKGTKELTIDSIPGWKSIISRSDLKRCDTCKLYSKELKINCTMIENWYLDRYPFDRQRLNIIIYNAARDSSYFRIYPDSNRISYNSPDTSNIIEIENGWVFSRDSAIVMESDNVTHDPFNRLVKRCGDNMEIARTYSSIRYSIPVRRQHQWLLFFKLQIGMYVAFFVAFISLFVDIKEAQSRFDLPVGGLFAAIANKYIIESILPQSPEFSLVDWLHSLTIIFILIIIAYSARLLHKVKAASDMNMSRPLKYDKLNRWTILTMYILINVVSLVWACAMHQTEQL